ncbi:MAG: hypothetical protein ACRD0I_00600 [Acidimicrobiales bacterium]
MSEKGIRGVRVVGTGAGLEDAPGSEMPGGDPTGVSGPGSGPEADSGPGSRPVATQTGDGSDKKPRRRFRRWAEARSAMGWRLVVLAVVAVLGLAGTIGFGLAWYNNYSSSNNVAAAKVQAQSFIIALTNFDPSTLDADFNKIQSLATDPFAGQARQFFGTDIRKKLLGAASASRGEIRSFYVQSATGNTVDFFAVVDETIINNQIKAPVADELRLVVEMKDTSSGWRVANVNVLQAPPSTTSSGHAPSSTTPTTPPAGTTATTPPATTPTTTHK